MRDVPIYRDYIPKADPIAARQETEKKCHVGRSVETLQMRDAFKIAEEFRIADVVTRCPDIPKRVIRDRLNRSGFFERVSYGLYKRVL